MTRWQGDKGVVLLNALVLVTALTAIAAFLLARSEVARLRQVEMQGAAQLRLYADAYESLATALLERDRRAGSIDHLGESWAAPERAVSVDRGQVAGQLEDLNGKFNINWLADPEDAFAVDGFARLAQRVGLSTQKVSDLTDFLQANGEDNTFGGPVVDIAHLVFARGMTPSDVTRLAPYLSALPGDSQINLNMVRPEVLQALIPDVGPSDAQRFDIRRRQNPFPSTEEALAALRTGAAPVILTEEQVARFSVASTWFEARITASLDGRVLRRITRFERRALPQPIWVPYRHTVPSGPSTQGDNIWR